MTLLFKNAFCGVSLKAKWVRKTKSDSGGAERFMGQAHAGITKRNFLNKFSIVSIWRCQ